MRSLDVEVVAVYELPVPIWVTCAALGSTYPSGYGSVGFNLAMPEVHPPVGAAPSVLGVVRSRETGERDDGLPASGDNGELTVWTQEFGAFIPESLRPATALIRVAVIDVQAPAHATRSWAGPDDRLVEVVASWFDQVRSWVEVITGQDLDPEHRVYAAEDVAPGLSFISPPHNASLALTITTPRIRPVQQEEWRMILAAVRDGREPPLEELLSRDARAAHARGSNRRATVDAATAVEVVLARVVTSREEQLPEAQAARLSRKPMFGTFIDIAHASGLEFAVPFEMLRALNKARIDAVHHGREPNSWDTANHVQVAIDFLGAHGPYTRSEEIEIDGSEWILHDVSEHEAPPDAES